jgi:hypothetical protein
MALEVGQVYEATLDVTNASGVLTNPATATLTITLPDATTTSPSITLPPAVTGHLICDYLTVQAGIHKAAWVTTTPGTAKTDYFTVRAYVSLISMAEAKAHLQITTAAYDEELSRFMQAATELVETRAGYSIRRQFTDEVDAPDNTAGLVLPRHPVLSVQSVTSVWPGGPSWVTADLLPPDTAGIVYRAIQGAGFWGGPWNIAYTVGRLSPPEKHLHAAKEQLRHLWETQRGSMAPALLSGEEVFTTTAGFSFSVPQRVLELLAAEMIPVF